MPIEDDRRGLYDDDKVLPKVHAFHAAELGRRLKNMFKPQSHRARRTVEGVPSNPRAFVRFERPGIAETFGMAKAILDRDKYLWQILETRSCSGVAYEILINVIGQLGPPRAGLCPDREDPADRFRDDVSRAQRAINGFCRVLEPGCATAYFYDRRLNRTQFLHENGLWLPEFCHGFVWHHDLPTIVLFDESHTTLYPPFPAASAQPETTGSFRERENVEATRVVAIRLAWDQSRVVLFLNWRREETKEHPNPFVKAICSSIEAAYKKPPPPSPMYPLQLAVRYFNGWLAVAEMDLSATPRLSSSIKAHTVITAAGAAALQEDTELRREALRGAVETAIAEKGTTPEDYHCNVHWINERVLTFKEDEYRDEKIDSQPKFGLHSPKQAKPEPQSICHMACIWDSPLLITDFDRSPPPFSGETWRGIHLKRSGFDCQSEIAVPVGEGQEMLGVVNVECRKPHGLGPTHVQRIELVTRLYGALKNALSSRSPEMCREFVTQQLIDPGRRIGSAQDLCKRFCEWVLGQLSADLAYLLIYDPRTRVFRPLGVSVSRANTLTFLTQRGEAANLGFDTNDPRQALAWRVMKRTTTDNFAPEAKESQKAMARAARALVEHAISNRLIPSRRRATWQVYKSEGWRGKFIPDISKKSRATQFPLSAWPYIQTLLGMRFSRSPRARTEGVLWVSWQDKNKAEKAMDLSLARPADRWIRTGYCRLQHVMEVVAAMYAVYRFLDSDGAADSLPIIT